jgi:glutamine synthetase
MGMALPNGVGLTREQVMELAERERVRFVNLQFTDIVGLVKSVTIPLHQLEEGFRNGKWFDGSAIEGYARIAESDMFLVPDPTTFAVVPWERDANAVTAKVICDVFNPDGTPFEGDPRHILRRAVQQAQQLGYEFKTGPELEFFLFHADEIAEGKYLTYDQAGYFDLSTDSASNVRKDMVNALEELGRASWSRPATTKWRSASTRSTSSTATPSAPPTMPSPSSIA